MSSVAKTSFSPDGQLFQVNYALEAVNRGTLAVGVTGKDCIVLAVEQKLLDKFKEHATSQKISAIEENIFVAISGLNADGRALIERAILQGQQYRFDYYQEKMRTGQLATEISKIKQHFTQSGGKRPFGVSCLIAGIDPTDEAEKFAPNLFLTEPSGTLVQYKACAIGRSSKSVIEYFEQNFSDDQTDEQAIKLAIQGILQVHQSPSKDTVKVLMIKKDQSEYVDEDFVQNIVTEYLEKQKEDAKTHQQ